MEAENIANRYFEGIPQDILERAKHIKLLITDIDGVMTDGGIIYDNAGMELKKFNVKDGLIVRHLRENKILVGAITGRKSQVVENRCEELKFDFHYHGVKQKGAKLVDLLETLELEYHEVAYIGDDLIDVPIMSRVGLAVASRDAMAYVKPVAHYVSKFDGGQGVFRETGDLILHAKGLLGPIIQSYQN